MYLKKTKTGEANISNLATNNGNSINQKEKSKEMKWTLLKKYKNTFLTFIITTIVHSILPQTSSSVHPGPRQIQIN